MVNNSKERVWLPHLSNSIPKDIYGYSISMYSLALEGWRRGLTLRFENINRSKAQTIFYLADGEKEHRFAVSRGDKVPQTAIKTCINKNLTKEHLIKADVPTPLGRVFEDSNGEKSQIIDYANKIGYPVVIKPVDGTGGKGVIANIADRNELKNAYDYVTKDLKFKNIIIEKHFEGIDCRVYVIEDKVVAATKRIPANVIGDGTSSISKLIKLKEIQRDKNPALYGQKFKIDKESKEMLSQQGYNMESIPQSGERVFLKSKNNVSAGGDSVDVTDELSSEIKKIATDAAKSIPGLVQAGVDLMVNLNNNSAEVIEINSRPHIRAQLFPEEGSGRDIPKAIIDYYFPDTKANHKEPLYYFDFQYIWEGFQSGTYKSISLPNVPRGNLKSEQIILTGNLRNINVGRSIKKIALSLELDGNVEHLENGELSIVISGNYNCIEKFKTNLINILGNNIQISRISKYRYPIKIGFEIINKHLDVKLKQGYNPITLKGIRNDLIKPNRKSKRSTKLSKDKTLDFKRKYNRIINSKSWKLTRPLRKIRAFLKK